eukprot:7391911-Prymnesium_polylepis.1
MRLYSGSDPMMKPMLAELISKLHDSSGRTEVINKFGACHEAAGDAVSAERKTTATPIADCYPAAGSRVILVSLRECACVHLNGQAATIRRFDDEIERYVVELDDGVHVCVKRGNLQLAEADDGTFISEMLFAHANDNISELAAVHGQQHTYRLLAELISLSCCNWTVADDVWLIAEHWRVRAGDSTRLFLQLLPHYQIIAPHQHTASREFPPTNMTVEESRTTNMRAAIHKSAAQCSSQV